MTQHAQVSQKQAIARFELNLDANALIMRNYVYKIGKVDSLTCGVCRSTDETVHHYLFHCPEYRVQREQMEHKLG
jgi:hypothetical protein